MRLKYGNEVPSVHSLGQITNVCDPTSWGVGTSMRLHTSSPLIYIRTEYKDTYSTNFDMPQIIINNIGSFSEIFYR